MVNYLVSGFPCVLEVQLTVKIIKMAVKAPFPLLNRAGSQWECR